ncbi:MAG: hypothetical protein ACO3JF_04085 [Ilumatobacteraceae bacterium]
MNAVKGAYVVRVNEILTALFVASAVLAVVVFENPWKVIAASIAVGSFVVGVVVFLWGYWTAVQRSRYDNIAVASMYFLTDKCAPSAIARRMNVMLGIQVVVSIATALIRSSTNGKPGSTLAFGILVPVLGIGMNGLWAALHGEFSPRNQGKSSGVPPEGPSSRQDDSHD